MIHWSLSICCRRFLPLPRSRPHVETPPRCAWGSSNRARHPLNCTWLPPASLKRQLTCYLLLSYESAYRAADVRISSGTAPHALALTGDTRHSGGRPGWGAPVRDRLIGRLDAINALIGVFTCSLRSKSTTEKLYAPPPPPMTQGYQHMIVFT